MNTDPMTSLIPVYLFFFCVFAYGFVRVKAWWEGRGIVVPEMSEEMETVVTLPKITWGVEEDVGTKVAATVPWRGLPTPLPSLEAERKERAVRHPLVVPIIVEDPRLDGNFRWLCRDSHHALIAGFTGSGKTSLCRGILIATSQLGKVQVIDTHGNAAKWGIPRETIRGVGSNFDDAIQALQELEQERIRRYEEFSHIGPGETKDFPRLTVIIEEFPELVLKAKEQKVNLSTILFTLVQGGREVNIHCIFVAQDTNAATMGAIGRAKSLSNMTQVVKGSQANDKLKTTGDPYATAIQRDGVRWVAMDTSFLPALTKKPISPESLWEQPAVQEYVDDDTERARALMSLAPEATATEVAFILFGSTSEENYQRALTLMGTGES